LFFGDGDFEYFLFFGDLFFGDCDLELDLYFGGVPDDDFEYFLLFFVGDLFIKI
jgi:hypothetical protein